MRILVAGWHGQVAMALSTAAARRADVSAYAVGRPALDLTDQPSIGRSLLSMAPDVIVNTASYTDVEGAEKEPQLAFRRNTQGAEALARKAASIGIPIIHLSTVYVFDGDKPTAYTETDEPNPINAYGRSKLQSEAAIASVNPNQVILRTGWIHSPFGRNFVTSILERATTESELLIDESQRGSLTYAPHLADAILDIAAQITSDPNNDRWGLYHIANQGTASWCDLAQEVFRNSEKMGGPSTTITSAGPLVTTNQAPRPLNATLDCTKLSNNWAITLPNWQDAVADCIGQINSN
jgi:dTDP-4-dehydrorhamnose reductase